MFRSPSISTESLPATEYQEWPFQGFLKSAIIENEITYNLEFKLPRILEHPNIPVPSNLLSAGLSKEIYTKALSPHITAAHSKVRPAISHAKKKRVPWSLNEYSTILQMKKQGCSWEEIHRALPHQTQGVIQVQYSPKLKR